MSDIDKIEKLEKELQELKQQQQNNIFSFNKINDKILKSIINIQRDLNDDIFEKWFNCNIDISQDTIDVLVKLLTKEAKYISIYSEEDLKMRFLSPLLLHIDFRADEFRDFYDEKLIYKTEDFILKGEVDFVFAKGLENSQIPYFFIQEFKQAEHFSNPRPQLLAEMIAGLELSEVKEFKGAYIVGAIWNFVILEKLGDNNYKYFVSGNFDSSKINDLKDIYKHLMYIKNDVLNL